MKRFFAFLICAATFLSCSDLLKIESFEDEEMCVRDTKGLESGTVTGQVPVSGRPLTAIADGGLAPLTMPKAMETAVIGIVGVNSTFPDIIVQCMSGESEYPLYYCAFNSFLSDGRPVFDKPEGIAAMPWSQSDVNVRIVKIGSEIYAARMDRQSVSFAVFNRQSKSFSQSFEKTVSLDLDNNPVGFDIVGNKLIVLTDDGSVYFPNMADRNYSLYNGAGIYFGELSNSHLYSIDFDISSFTAGKPELVSGNSLVMLNGGSLASFRRGNDKGYLVAGRLGAVNFVPQGNETYNAPAVTAQNDAVINPCYLNSIVAIENADGSAVDFITSGDGALHYCKFAGSFSSDGAPVYNAPVQLMMLGGELFGGTACVPTVADWDGDNVLDIVTGNSEGRFLFFKNYGTNEAPAFGEAVTLKVNGKDACRRAGYYSLGGPFDSAWGYTSPVVFDWNEDGVPDILFSSNASRIDLYLGNGKQGEDCLKTIRSITYDGLDVWGTWQNRPAVAKIGGSIVIAVMDEDNAVHLYRKRSLTNVCQVGKLTLSDGGYITGNRRRDLMTTLTEIGRTKLEFCDWDGDGDQDLLVGTTSVGAFPSESGIPYSLGTPNMQMMIFENVGEGDGEMVFAKPRMFEAFGGNFYMGSHAVTPTFCGLGDTRRGPNMLVGTESGKFYFFERHDLREKEY